MLRSRQCLLALCVVLAGCGDRSSRRKPPIDDARPHSDRSHDENHYYVAVTRTGLDPASLAVPRDQDVILLFDRRLDATCTGIRIEMSAGRVVEQALSRERPVEVHVRFDTTGPHAYRCITGTPIGTIDVR